MRTKCGSGEALDFGLEMSEIWDLVSGAVRGHPQGCCSAKTT